MSWVRVPREEFNRIRKLAADRKAKREEKRKALPWAKTSEPTPSHGEKRKRRKPSMRWSLIKKLDAVFSLYIRARDKRVTGGKCVFGCGRPIECCFHFVTRAKYAVRWDVENAVGSCTIDNYTNEFNPHPYVGWYIKRYGLGKYEDLLRRSNSVVKRTDLELLEIARDLKVRLEALPAI